MLAIRNMARLGHIDADRARELTVATISVFALGFTVLLIAAQPAPGRSGQFDSNVTALLSLGTAAVAYIAQRPPFVIWRRSHLHDRTSSFVTGLVLALTYTGITILASVVLRLLVGLVAGLIGWGPGQLQT